MLVGKDSGKYHIISEINMIPFIDVSLVLLIIFMVMTPFLVKSQIKLNLPSSSASENIKPDEKTVDIQVQADGAIYVEGARISEDALEKTLKSKIRDPKSQAVMIEADKKVAFQHVVTAMSAAKKLGVTRLGVSVKEERAGKGSGKKSR